MSLPSFSIVVPTYNRPPQLAACLQALTQLDYPGDRVEIIIVDDGSTDDTAKIVSQMSFQMP
ncbi:MAG: glycosyltransferase, partial [Cyanobacteria bacterium J06576_12]